MRTTKNFKVFALILLTSALLLVAINPSIPTVKAATQDSVYIYVSIGGTISAGGTNLTGGDSYSYNNGTTVDFQATATSGFTFLCWEYASSAGGVVSTVNPLALTLTESEYGVQAMYLPTTNATISSSTATGATTVDLLTSAGGSTVPAAGTYTNYTLGKVASFSVVAGKGFKFLYWIVSCTPGTFTTTASTLSFNLAGSTYFAIQAMFVPSSSTVTLPTPTINEFSSATAIIIATVLVIVAFGTYAFTKRSKK
jgi:hypothetical protein